MRKSRRNYELQSTRIFAYRPRSETSRSNASCKSSSATRSEISGRTSSCGSQPNPRRAKSVSFAQKLASTSSSLPSTRFACSSSRRPSHPASAPIGIASRRRFSAGSTTAIRSAPARRERDDQQPDRTRADHDYALTKLHPRAADRMTATDDGSISAASSTGVAAPGTFLPRRCRDELRKRAVALADRHIAHIYRTRSLRFDWREIGIEIRAVDFKSSARFQDCYAHPATLLNPRTDSALSYRRMLGRAYSVFTLRASQENYSTTTSSGKRNVVAPSANCTRYMRRSRLFTSRRMRGCSPNRLRPSWSRTGRCSLQCLPATASVLVLVIILLPLHFIRWFRSTSS